MRKFIAFYNGRQVELKASSAYDAKQAGVQYFKPAGSKEHMVHVVLADVEISTASL